MITAHEFLKMMSEVEVPMLAIGEALCSLKLTRPEAYNAETLKWYFGSLIVELEAQGVFSEYEGEGVGKSFFLHFANVIDMIAERDLAMEMLKDSFNKERGEECE